MRDDAQAAELPQRSPSRATPICVDAWMRTSGRCRANGREKPEVLHDDGVHARRPRLVHEREGIGHLIGQDQDVRSEVDAHAAKMRVAGRLGKLVDA